MESMRTWTAERGIAIEPHGPDASARLAGLERSRLPAWADRIHVGDARTWSRAPALRFDSARTELGHAAPAERPALIARLLHMVVKADGRLIACWYGSTSAGIETVEPVADPLRGWGSTVAGEAGSRDSKGVRFTRVAWVDGPGRIAP
jgi:hypothetical protein